jgi:hypothetical protein
MRTGSPMGSTEERFFVNCMVFGRRHCRQDSRTSPKFASPNCSAAWWSSVVHTPPFRLPPVFPKGFPINRFVKSRRLGILPACRINVIEVVQSIDFHFMAPVVRVISSDSLNLPGYRIIAPSSGFPVRIPLAQICSEPARSFPPHFPGPPRTSLSLGMFLPHGRTDAPFFMIVRISPARERINRTKNAGTKVGTFFMTPPGKNET